MSYSCLVVFIRATMAVILHDQPLTSIKTQILMATLGPLINEIGWFQKWKA